MPRTPIAPELIHRAEDLARDASRLGALRDALVPHARPRVLKALLREAHTAEAGAWLADARTLLVRLPADEASDDAMETSRRELQASLGTDATTPDAAEVTALTRDLADALARAWVNALDAALASDDAVALDAALVPTEGAEAIVEALAHAAEPYGLTAREAREVLGDLREEYARGAGVRALPLGVVITAERGALVARRESATERRDVVQSGEQLREGAVAPPDAAGKQGRPPR